MKIKNNDGKTVEEILNEPKPDPELSENHQPSDTSDDDEDNEDDRDEDDNDDDNNNGDQDGDDDRDDDEDEQEEEEEDDDDDGDNVPLNVLAHQKREMRSSTSLPSASFIMCYDPIAPVLGEKGSTRKCVRAPRTEQISHSECHDTFI